MPNLLMCRVSSRARRIPNLYSLQPVACDVLSRNIHDSSTLIQLFQLLRDVENVFSFCLHDYAAPCCVQHNTEFYHTRMVKCPTRSFTVLSCVHCLTISR